MLQARTSHLFRLFNSSESAEIIFFKKREIFSLIKSVSSYNNVDPYRHFFLTWFNFFSHTIILWSVYSAGSSTSKNISDLIMLVVYSLLQALIKNTLQFAKSRSASSPPSSHRDHPRRLGVPHVRLIKNYCSKTLKLTSKKIFRAYYFFGLQDYNSSTSSSQIWRWEMRHPMKWAYLGATPPSHGPYKSSNLNFYICQMMIDPEQSRVCSSSPNRESRDISFSRQWFDDANNI